MKFLKVPKSKGEKTRRELVSKGLLSKEFSIGSDATSILLPITKEAQSTVQKQYPKFELVELKAKKRKVHPNSIEEALSGTLTKDEIAALTTSFDLIGDIAIVEIPDPLSKHETLIGQALLSVHRNIKTVLKKTSPMEGEYRVRKLQHIAGENRTTTTYKESGVPMELDVAKVYFSVRLSHERKRIAELVKPNEHILALFAGVGPFPLVIAKRVPSAQIVAIELNPDAAFYLRKNIERNRKHAKNVTAVEGDARAVVMAKYADFADRILMPLPKGAHEFLDAAFAGVKSGGIVHFYTFADISDPFADAMRKAEKVAAQNGVHLTIIDKRIVRPYSPAMVQVVLDLRVKKNG